MGTPWITQRGFDVALSRRLADIMADVLLACAPHYVDTPHKGRQRRAKVDFAVLNNARLRVRKLAAEAGIDFKPSRHGYPHFYYLDERVKSGVLEISGDRARQMLDYAVSADLSGLKPGKSQTTDLATPNGKVHGVLTCVDRNTYRLSLPTATAGIVATWLRDLSDGYLSFNLDGTKDFSANRMPGPFVVMGSSAKPAVALSSQRWLPPWHVGIGPETRGSLRLQVGRACRRRSWANGGPRFTRLHETHKSVGGWCLRRLGHARLVHRSWRSTSPRGRRLVCSTSATWAL
jgi:glycine hydroxymethyltransferase